MVRPESSLASRGFTLVELVLALALTTILLGGMASVMVLTMRALPGAGDPAGQSALAGQAGRAITSAADEMRYARTISTIGPREIGYTLADRTGNGQPELIRLAWSGVAGDPLLRRLNGGEPRAILTNVQEFGIQTAVVERDGASAVRAVTLSVRTGAPPPGPGMTVVTTVRLLNGPPPP